MDFSDEHPGMMKIHSQWFCYGCSNCKKKLTIIMDIYPCYYKA